MPEAFSMFAQDPTNLGVIAGGRFLHIRTDPLVTVLDAL